MRPASARTCSTPAVMDSSTVTSMASVLMPAAASADMRSVRRAAAYTT